DLLLGDVNMASGNLTVTSKGNIDQATLGTGIRTAGTATFKIDSNARDITLDHLPNKVTGTVTFAQQNGGVVSNLALRHAAVFAVATAALPVTTGLTSLTDYSLTFDNNGIAMPATSIAGVLQLEAGGPITQTGVFSAAGGIFIIDGNFGITLTSANNI